MARILVAEDEEDVAMLVQFKLEQEGHEVVMATDGREALEMYREHGAEVAVLDVMMPKIDGLAVARSLSAAAGGPRILMLTARGREADIDAGFEAGADDYLVKPFSPRELVRRVDALLRR